MSRTFRPPTLVFAFCLAISTLAPFMSAGWAGTPDDDDDDRHSPIQVGYAIVTPTSSNKTGLVVFETFGEHRPSGTTQAGVLPSAMTTKALVVVGANGRLSRNLGVAIANPSDLDMTVTLDLKDAAGQTVASKGIPLAKHSQVARFVTELFADRPAVVQDFQGTLTISSTQPFAVVGLRFRGENFSTTPATNLSATTVDIPLIGGVGGPGAVILAHFAAGGGWNSEIIIANASDKDVTLRVDLFKQDGTPLVTELNHQLGSTFSGISVKAGGLIVLAPLNKHGDSDF